MIFRLAAETPGIYTIMSLTVFWQIRFNGENELFKMQKVIELKHQVSVTFQCLNELGCNNSGEMSEFDSGLYFRVAFFAFLIPLGSGEFSIVCNLGI